LLTTVSRRVFIFMIRIGDIRVILLDIEGTTTPVDFVYKTLFPYATLHVEEFLKQNHDRDDVRSDIKLLWDEHRNDLEAGAEPPEWTVDSLSAGPEVVAEYVRWQMSRDRKSTGLKSLQGKIWEAGYRSRKLQGDVYPDVHPALQRWKAQGKRIYIFSSGSVLAQRLLFESTVAGDLNIYIDGYFDTTVGSKLATDSYSRIAAEVNEAPNGVLFISDVVAELDAARRSGMETRLCIRTSDAGPEQVAHTLIRSFDVVSPSRVRNHDGGMSH
jgi:enolase-phosphatase E1